MGYSLRRKLISKVMALFQTVPAMHLLLPSNSVVSYAPPLRMWIGLQKIFQFMT